MDNGKRMTIFEHLEDLRGRLIKSVIALLVTTLFSLIFTSRFLKILTAPMGNLQPIFLRPTEMIITYFKIALICGVALAMPVIIYQFVLFILPALKPKEKRYLYIIVPGATISFVIGLLFAYFALLPFAVRYLLSFGGDIARAQWTIGEYIGFVTTILLWIGVAFETPLVIFFLAKVGIVTPAMLSRYRKYAVLAAAVIAAIITPTPDPFNMMIVMVPLYLLYEAGALLAKLA
ncbi:MAG TPA: twin-arginine translocase subunit TatC [Chloroflexi bacterium]|nr:twin-arginine translocase subunit TatC [Chloroflexota bacterium]